MSEEASLLLAKVEYAQGNHVAALELYENAGLISTKSDVHMYKKKIYSEAFAIQGLVIFFSIFCVCYLLLLKGAIHNILV